MISLNLYQQYSNEIGRPITEWQIRDWELADYCTELCICRSRGGSKTKDFVDWLVLRCLHYNEKWAWLASYSGQLTQAKIYFKQNKYVKRFFNDHSRQMIELWNGNIILFGIISLSNLGLRLDGIIIDEEEAMEQKQTDEVYPQMAGMLSVSKVAKRIHLGTLWNNTQYVRNCHQFPTSKHGYKDCKWIKRRFIEEEIRKRPEWEINLLYRCIEDTPHGIVFNNIKWVTEQELDTLSLQPTNCGIDINKTEAIVLDHITDHQCIILKEMELDFIKSPSDFDFLKGISTETEDGGYNEKEAQLLVQRIGCSKSMWTSDIKSVRQAKGRQLQIVCCKTRTPNIAHDLENTQYDPNTGLYFKHPTKNPCHWLDAWLHSLHTHFSFTPKWLGQDSQMSWEDLEYKGI